MYSVDKNDMKEVLETAIRMTVRETVAELKKTGFFRPPDRVAYKDTAKRLYRYYEAKKAPDGEPDKDITSALKHLKDDPYYGIIWLYFCEKKTVEEIGEMVSCDPSTVARNKKKLVLKIHNFLMTK